MGYYTRNSKVETLLKKHKSVLLLGPRGSGKSTYINKKLSEWKSEVFTINLLETDSFRKYLQSPHLLRKEVEYKLKNCEFLTIFIDEIQKVPQLLDEVHLMIEKYKTKCTFILTGSSARKLKKENVNLLAGRAIKVSFFPFSFEEIDVHSDFSRILKYGMLPEACTGTDDDLVIDYLKTYTGTYLKEEIMQESLKRDIQVFSNFLEVAAFANGTPVNHLKIARQIGISDQTIKSHYQMLEDTLMVHKIPAWTFSIRKQLQKAAKYYFFDNGILNALTGELRVELKQSSFLYGKLFENFIVNEIIKFNELHDFDYHLYHYRTNHGSEIDIILQKNVNAAPVAVEIKSAENPTYSDVKNLSDFLLEHENAKACVLCRAKEPYEENGISFYPFEYGLKTIFELCG